MKIGEATEVTVITATGTLAAVAKCTIRRIPQAIRRVITARSASEYIVIVSWFGLTVTNKDWLGEYWSLKILQIRTLSLLEY
jgi:hypothetical protein